MLSDVRVYKKLSYDPTMEVYALLDSLLQEGVYLGIINTKQKEYMLVKNSLCLIFHALPKIHKNRFSPPMRPILSRIGSLTDRDCVFGLISYCRLWFTESQFTLKILRKF